MLMSCSQFVGSAALMLTHFPRVIKVGALPSRRVCCTPISGTTTPSDSRCPPRIFTIGLYASVMRRSVKTTSGFRVGQGLAVWRHRARVLRDGARPVDVGGHRTH